MSNIQNIFSQDPQGQEQGVQNRTVPLTPSNLLGNFLIFVFKTLSSAGLKVLVSEGKVLPLGATWNERSIGLEAQTFLWPLGASEALSQEAEEGITVLGGVIDPETKREMISSLQWRKRIMCGGARAP